MRVAIFSTFNECCGVAEYTKNLVDELNASGVETHVIANFSNSPLEEDPCYVHRLFHTPFLTHSNLADLASIATLIKDLLPDVCHFQFETNIYSPDYFSLLVDAIKVVAPRTKILFTMHSSGIWPSFDPKKVDHFISHEPMWCTDTVIPMGVKFNENQDEPESYNSITSFGLGRNNDETIRAIIAGTDITYNPTYGHNKWLPKNQLISTIKKSWIISLLYPPVGNTNVSSSAVITAMSCSRPIIVSNTNWFKHVLDYPNIYVCDTPQEIAKEIKYLTDPNNIVKIKSDIQDMKIKIIEDHRSFQDFVTHHISVYNFLTNAGLKENMHSQVFC